MKYLIAVLFALNAHFICAHAQGQYLIDSLAKELSRSGEDTNKAAILDKLSFTYSNIDPNEGIKYATRLLELSTQLHWNKGIAAANADMGINYEAKSDHAKALEYNFKALRYYDESNNKKNAAGVLVNIALVYLAQSNYLKALEYDFKALGIYEELGNNINRAIILENIGSIYFEQKDYAKTTEYYSHALKIYTDIGDKGSMARNLGNMGIVLDAKENYTEALKNHMMALAINKELGNKNSIQINLANIGYVYSHLKDYSKALEYQMMALKISEEFGNKNSIAINLGNIGETFFSIANNTIDTIKYKPHTSRNKEASLRQAIQYLEKAVAICKEINFSAPLVEFNQYLSEAYFLTANYKKAYENLKQYATIKDSVFSIQNKILIANIETKRKIELKDKDLLIKNKQLKIKQLEVIQKRNQTTLYIISIALLLLVIVLVLKGLYTYRRSNRRLLKERNKDLNVIEKQVKHIQEQTDIIRQIAHIQAHDIRGPVAFILGLVKLFNFDDLTDPTNKVVIQSVASITAQLDIAVQEVIKKENITIKNNLMSDDKTSDQ